MGNGQELHPPTVKSESEESAFTHPTKDLKQEEDHSKFPGIEEDNENPELAVSSSFQGETEKCGTKRDHELEQDSPYINSTEKLSMSAVKKKKGNLKNAGDNQPTLLSYFGKS